MDTETCNIVSMQPSNVYSIPSIGSMIPSNIYSGPGIISWVPSNVTGFLAKLFSSDFCALHYAE